MNLGEYHKLINNQIVTLNLKFIINHDVTEEMKKQSFTYKTLKFFINIFYKKRKFEGLENINEEPCIIIGNHAQIHGPLIAEVQFPLKRKTWCIGNVLTKKEFIEHAKTDFWGLKPKCIRWF